MNTAKYDHLEVGEKPLITCFDNLRTSLKERLLSVLGINGNLDYYGGRFKNRLLGNMSLPNNYVISGVNGRNKTSKNYYNCTGLILIGRDKKGRNISLLTHQNPSALFDSDCGEKIRESFLKDLQMQIDSLKSLALEGSVDAFIVGGNYLNSDGDEYKLNYEKSLELLGEIVYQNFGFYPGVSGPILEAGYTNVTLDTKNRRIFQQRGLKDNIPPEYSNSIFTTNDFRNIKQKLDLYCKNRVYEIWEII